MKKHNVERLVHWLWERTIFNHSVQFRRQHWEFEAGARDQFSRLKSVHHSLDCWKLPHHHFMLFYLIEEIVLTLHRLDFSIRCSLKRSHLLFLKIPLPAHQNLTNANAILKVKVLKAPNVSAKGSWQSTDGFVDTPSPVNGSRLVKDQWAPTHPIQNYTHPIICQPNMSTWLTVDRH